MYIRQFINKIAFITDDILLSQRAIYEWIELSPAVLLWSRIFRVYQRANSIGRSYGRMLVDL